MGYSNPWKRRATGHGIQELNQRSPEFRHHSDSALIAIHNGLDNRLLRLAKRIRISFVVLLFGFIGALVAFRAVTWLGYIFSGVTVLGLLAVIYAMHAKEKCANELTIIKNELTARGCRKQ